MNFVFEQRTKKKRKFPHLAINVFRCSVDDDVVVEFLKLLKTFPILLPLLFDLIVDVVEDDEDEDDDRNDVVVGFDRMNSFFAANNSSLTKCE